MTSFIRQNIRRLKPYECARQTAQKGVMLDANENPYGNTNRYPDPNSTEIKKLLCEILKVKPGNLFVGNGSDEAINLIIRIFCREGDEIITLDPTYGMYKVSADINEVKTKSVQLDGKFQIDIAKTLKKITKKTRIIFVCSPNNPTGNLIRETDILKLCRKLNGITVVDEAYIEFTNKPLKVGKIIPNLIRIRTLSKAWGGAGIRIGYAISSPEIAEALNKIKTPYNVSLLDQKAAEKILRNKKIMLGRRQEILKEREKITKKLRELKLEVYKSDANFILFKIPGAKEIQRKLKQQGIIIRDRSEMPLLQNCLRVSIGTKKENNLFLEQLEKCLEKVAFIDRDGVLIYEPQTDFQIDSLKKYKLLKGVSKALRKLRMYEYKLVMVSNQDGLGTKSFPKKDFQKVQRKLLEDLDTKFEKCFICPHTEKDNCRCRKPKTGLVEKFLKETPINYKKSVMIGDRESDMEFARNIGIRGLKATTNSDSLLKIINQLLS